MVRPKKMQRNVGLVSKHPGIMWFAWNMENVSGVDFNNASIGERRCGRAGEYEPYMFNVAATLSQIAPYVFGPAPSRLICGATNGHASKASKRPTGISRTSSGSSKRFSTISVYSGLTGFSSGSYIRSGIVNPCR